MRVLLVACAFAALLASPSHAAMMLTPSEWVLSVGADSQTFNEVPPAATSLSTAAGSVSTVVEYEYIEGIDYVTITHTLESIGGAEVVTDGEVRFMVPSTRYYTLDLDYLNPDPANMALEIYVKRGRSWPVAGEPYHHNGALGLLEYPIGWRISHTGSVPATVTMRFSARVPEPGGWAFSAMAVAALAVLRTRRGSLNVPRLGDASSGVPYPTSLANVC